MAARPRRLTQRKLQRHPLRPLADGCVAPPGCYSNRVGTTILDGAFDRVRVARLTVDQYDAMVERGILPEGTPVELIDGVLVFKNRSAMGADPMTVGTAHSVAATKLAGLAAKFERLNAHIRTQQPIRLPPSHEPEPDGSVVAGKPEAYARRHPATDDVLSVIEVSESSLAYDKTTKLRLYAAAGVRQYVVVNIPERCVEVYSAPIRKEARYAKESVRRASQELAIAAGRKSVRVKARDLLP